MGDPFIKGYHGLTKGELTAEKPRFPFFVAYERGLAETYAYKDDDDPGTVVIVKFAVENPLHLDTPEKVRDWWTNSGALNWPGTFHENLCAAVELDRQRGHDAVFVPPPAFEGDLGFDWSASTFGEPQMILLSPLYIEIIDPTKEEAA